MNPRLSRLPLMEGLRGFARIRAMGPLRLETIGQILKGFIFESMGFMVMSMEEAARFERPLFEGAITAAMARNL